MAIRTNRQNPSEPFVDVATVARLLGVPRSWVYERTARGEIPCYRVGRLLRFRVSEVERWLAEGGAAVERGEHG